MKPHAIKKPANIFPGKVLYFGGFLSMPSRATIIKYMQGDCGHFALALNKRLPGSQIWKVGEGHFAVQDQQGDFWDIRGKMGLEQLWNGLAGENMIMQSRQQVINELNSGVFRCGVYSKSKEAVAKKIIQCTLLSPQTPTPIQKSAKVAP